MKNPSVFISYSWDNQEHKDWVTAFANELRKNGIDAKIDEFIIQKGTVNLNRMMLENIRDSDYIIIVLTDKYAEKAELFKGGVGYETSLLINEIVKNIQKVIPIMKFNGDPQKAIPYYLQGVTYIDFSNTDNYCDKLEELKYKILKKDRIEMEPLGEIPDLKPRKVTMETLQINKTSSISNELIPDFREITDRDKDRFMKQSYTEIIEYLSDLAEQTKQRNQNFDYEIDVVTNKKSIVKYYINGMEKHAVKIWVGSTFSRNESILLSYGKHYFNSDNSCNEIIECEVNMRKELKLKMTMNMFGDRTEKDAKDIAEEIWKSCIPYLK